MAAGAEKIRLQIGEDGPGCANAGCHPVDAEAFQRMDLEMPDEALFGMRVLSKSSGFR